MDLIQGHLDRYGLTRAEFSRRIGTRPQTVQNWKDKPGILPTPELLRGVATVIDTPYLIVLDAALVDSGYRVTDVDDVTTLEMRAKKLAERDPAALRQLAAYVRLLERDIDAEDASAHATRDLADRIADIIRREFDVDNGGDSGQQVR
jgi:transcriptional regulator with XRE-family HTH domain